MKKLTILFTLFLLISGCEENKLADDLWDATRFGETQARTRYMRAQAQQTEKQLYGDNLLQVDKPKILQPDAYGLGVHQNRYGQAVTVRPDFGGVQGENLRLELDAYGLSIHKDQYGRPVREYPWP